SRSGSGSATTPSASSPSPRPCWPTPTPPVRNRLTPPRAERLTALPGPVACQFVLVTGTSAGETGPVTDTDPAQLLAAVERLRDSADRLHLPLAVASAEPARVTRRELVQQLDDYVLPRLR